MLLSFLFDAQKADEEQLVTEKGWTEALNVSRGVAGQKNFSCIKCLHAHYAHWLATKNDIVGEWVHELVLRCKASDEVRVILILIRFQFVMPNVGFTRRCHSQYNWMPPRWGHALR